MCVPSFQEEIPIFWNHSIAFKHMSGVIQGINGCSSPIWEACALTMQLYVLLSISSHYLLNWHCVWHRDHVISIT